MISPEAAESLPTAPNPPNATAPNATAPNATASSTTAPNSATAGQMAQDEVEIALQIPSDAEFVRVVRLAVMGVASRMAFSFDDIEDMKLAVSEACNNAILHACVPPEQVQIALGADASGLHQTVLKPPIVVRLLPYDDRLEISVEDGGRIASPGLLVRRARKPFVASDEAELPEGGMGLFLIQSLMDEVQHHNGDNANTIISMIKYLPRHALKTPAKNVESPRTSGSSAAPVASERLEKRLPTS